MSMGDARGRFDVAYSLEFGLGTEKDTARAAQMYQEILASQESQFILVCFIGLHTSTYSV